MLRYYHYNLHCTKSEVIKYNINSYIIFKSITEERSFEIIRVCKSSIIFLTRSLESLKCFINNRSVRKNGSEIISGIRVCHSLSKCSRFSTLLIANNRAISSKLAIL